MKILRRIPTQMTGMMALQDHPYRQRQKLPLPPGVCGDHGGRNIGYGTAAVSYTHLPLFQKTMSEKKEIVRVVKPIRSGEEITADMVKNVEVGSYNLPEDVVKQLDTVIGAFASADLAPCLLYTSRCV